ncbi:MAG: ATP-dependent Clp protease proteolytic subunit [Myxococcales bacterium]|nr:ATP-dependent Clp protease proteolytic subunit [Myxococcales bacterium]
MLDQSDPKKADDERDEKVREGTGLTSKLLDMRTVLVFGEITTELAERTIAQLFALEAKGPEPVRVVIHSQGGHVEAGDAIFDVIRFIKPEVTTIGTGWVASAGALVFVAAERQNRLALPNTRFLLHQPLGGVRGPESDIAIEAAQILEARARLTRIFANATGQPVEKVAADTERNLWMNAKEAVAYGLVGRIVEKA